MTRASLLLCASLLASSQLSFGTTISRVIAYGDSLSDNGNFFAAIGQPGPPYFNGRASNGPVAVEQLANARGIPLLDFAWLGATTGVGNHLDPGGTPTNLGLVGLPGMTTSFGLSIAAITPLAPTSLFVVWGGGDDFLSPSPLDATPFDVANRAVDNIVNIAASLQGLGAGRVLVPGLPDLGLTPSALAQGPIVAAQLSALSVYFNSRLLSLLPNGVLYYDTAALLNRIVADPAAFGFTNVTSPCFDAIAGTVCTDPDKYLFWDDLHPTEHGSRVLAIGFSSAVPEPGTFSLVAVAGIALLWARRKYGVRPR